MKLLKCVILALCLLVGNVYAVNIWWNGSLNSDWGTAANWNSGILPGSSDTVLLGAMAGSYYPEYSTGTTTVNLLTIGKSTNSKLTVSGGTLKCTSNFVVSDKADGILNITGGTVEVVSGLFTAGFKDTGVSGNADVNVAGGTLTVSAGDIDLGMDPGGFANLTLNSGAINVNSTNGLYVGRWGPAAMTVNSGTVSIGNVLTVAPGSYDANLVVNGGNITGPSHSGVVGVQQLWVGYHPSESYAHGRMDMYGGSLTAAWAIVVGHAPYSTGEINIYGGNITLAQYLTINDDSIVNLAGGQLIIKCTWLNMNDVYTTLVDYNSTGKLVAFGGGTNKVLHIDKNSPLSGQITVWGENLSQQTKASNPVPLDGATLYTPVKLEWLQGIGAATQNVYVGTNETAVTNATVASPEFKTSLSGSIDNYVPTIELAKTYYWRIDTVKADTTVVKGDTWGFTVGDYFVIEDSESYSSTLSNWTAAGSGTVALDSDTSDLGYKWGYLHGKAVELSYNNTSTAYAEAIYTIPTAFNVTKYNCGSLWIDIHGAPNNVGTTEPLSIILEDSDGTRSSAVLYTGTSVQRDLVQENWEVWYRWSIAKNDFAAAGFDANNVKKLIVHIGGATPSGATGKLLIDDIRIYPPICTGAHKLYGDFTGDCQINVNDLEVIARDWLMGPTVVSAATPPTPILWYKFNETSGSSVHDEIAGHDGAIRTGPTWVVGGGPDGSNCISINGGRTTGTYGISVPTEVFADITNTISFSVWVKGDATNPVSPTGSVFTGSNTETSVWDSNGASSTKIFFQCPYESGYVAFGCGMTAPSSFDSVTWTSSFINDWRDIWVHYACVKDGASGTMSIYRDGKLVEQRLDGATKPISNINYFWVGATQLYGYEGKIDDFRIYNVALTPAQIVSLANKASITQHLLAWRAETTNDGKVNFADFAAMAQLWLAGETLWPSN